jgi:dipeptidase
MILCSALQNRIEMKKFLLIAGLITLTGVFAVHDLIACTSILVTKGASRDGSTMITYAADAHVLYGELYRWPAAEYPVGAMLDVYEWDTGKFLGQIKQVAQTYSVIGNMNEHQVAISETTYGGRSELRDPNGIMDYGSLIYIALQRAKNAREAILIMTSLVEEYGYYSSGESFSIADANEVWILELIGKGEEIKTDRRTRTSFNANKGAVWVAMRIPDGYISAHANQARITSFPLENGNTSISSKNIDKIFEPSVEVVYAHDVISFARSKGYFDGNDSEFSFVDAYAPLDFGALRFCEARVWSVFRRVNSEMDRFIEYIKGDISERMPLWIKPSEKLDVKDVMELMRDHYAGTEFDMSQDVGAGPFALPYRWRPMTWQVDGEGYVHERAISTQQTGFSFVSQSRNWLPDPIGGILWFGLDDTYSTVYMPMYCGMLDVPYSMAVGNGSMVEFTWNSAFWVFNFVSNWAYLRYSDIIKDVRELQAELEGRFIAYTPAIDKAAQALYEVNPQMAREFLTDYSVQVGNNTTDTWREFGEYLINKYIDGNIKREENGQFRLNPYGYPANPAQPRYPDDWYRRIVRERGDVLKQIDILQ